MYYITVTRGHNPKMVRQCQCVLQRRRILKIACFERILLLPLELDPPHIQRIYKRQHSENQFQAITFGVSYGPSDSFKLEAIGV